MANTNPWPKFALLVSGQLTYLFAVLLAHASYAQPAGDHSRFYSDIQPLLEEYCLDCHGNGESEGGLSLDEDQAGAEFFTDQQRWWSVLKNLRADIMPPPEMSPLDDEQKKQIADWIKADVFGIDPQNIDPGPATVRRMNRFEYGNTIRDLMGVEYDVAAEFPPDDSGFGFDNVGHALTLSPMLLEKYLHAAQTIVTEAQQEHQPPADSKEWRGYATDVLSAFALRAFRRPSDDATLERLVAIAESVYQQPDETFEAGVAQAMVAALTSPRFLFLTSLPAIDENALESADEQTITDVDEYSLASRLSYFFWSSMPDEELLKLAAAGQLRANLTVQVDRLLANSRSEAMVRSFVGQWLRARDVAQLTIEPLAARGLQDEFDTVSEKIQQLRLQEQDADDQHARQNAQNLQTRYEELLLILDSFDEKLRRAMRQETEMMFSHVVKENRSVLDFLDSDYAFLNETLANHYGIPGVEGDAMRRVTLPEGCHRGGVLTQGTFLTVTSNPTRTSPVKRGLFILENLLGSPPPPPPPGVPELEKTAERITEGQPTLREVLKAHLEADLCRSCHLRMDPLGLAIENYDALGMWRDKEGGQESGQEGGQPIDASGELLSGQSFENLQQLKKILQTEHRDSFYRCLTEKLLTYALGRGLDYYDVETVDQIVARLEQEDGKIRVLLDGIVHSAPFQKQRTKLFEPLINADGR